MIAFAADVFLSHLVRSVVRRIMVWRPRGEQLSDAGLIKGFLPSDEVSSNQNKRG